jgi:hypothetical protein
MGFNSGFKGLKVKDDPAELDEKLTDRLDKQLKDVTSLVG